MELRPLRARNLDDACASLKRNMEGEPIVARVKKHVIAFPHPRVWALEQAIATAVARAGQKAESSGG